jgi:EAL and modified HD-GYP domain-containing signal transduction protein
MDNPDSALFPLVEVQAVANARNEWVAMLLRVGSNGAELTTALQSLLGVPGLLAAVAPLDCVLLLPTVAILTPAVLERLPRDRVVFAISAAALAAEGEAILALQARGYRCLLDGMAAAEVPVAATLGALALDCSAAAPQPDMLPAMSGPHLAYGVNGAERFTECQNSGFSLFSGAYPLHPAPSGAVHDGTSRRRLLALLGLLARDADSRELETQLKQDPALSYHLLKLVNSAAFALSTPITSFGQAIGLLGRRQLQRWLQLLLYTRQQADGLPNLLLPIAALRGAQMEALCKLDGGERDEQDLAFMLGVFSLLDVLLAMPMAEIVGALNLPPLVAAALLQREGRAGQLLRLVETASPALHDLKRAGISAEDWWQSQLHAYHWAIQVARNV